MVIIFPFDVLPRIVDGSEWTQIEAGLKQRIFALNAFLEDIYNKRQILKDRIIPEDLINNLLDKLLTPYAIRSQE